jgi:hypothetical protein
MISATEALCRHLIATNPDLLIVIALFCGAGLFFLVVFGAQILLIHQIERGRVRSADVANVRHLPRD